MPDISVFSSVRPCCRFVLHVCNLIFFPKSKDNDVKMLFYVLAFRFYKLKH